MIDRSPPSSVAVAAPVWNGAELLTGITAATTWLEAHRNAINALNVFPVPDGDTGTNMSLTMRAAVEEGRTALSDGATGAGDVAAKVAYGALMGARGNSGVILSQIFRGFSRALEGREEIDGRDIAISVESARIMAYKAMMRPVEGTMLTVIRGADEQARLVAARTPSLATVLDAAAAGARDALATTPDLLEILRQAGVVDAGGQGVVRILEGLAAHAHGETLGAMPTTGDVVSAVEVGSEMTFLDRIGELHGSDEFGYCTNFVVIGADLDIDRCRTELSAMGESAVIVGDYQILKVHIHTPYPGKVLEYATALGDLDQIKIDNMQSQTRSLKRQRVERQGASGVEPAAPDRRSSDMVVLAVAEGDGMAAALTDMGAAGIISGGQTMNPSIQQVLTAVSQSPANQIILLPNNSNIVLTANQVPALTEKRVLVVPSRSIPQGIAALSAFNADIDLETNCREMTAALASVRTVEITRAVRDATIDDVCVRCGQTIGIHDGRLLAAGDDPIQVSSQTLKHVGLDEAELVTIFSGAETDCAQLDALSATLRKSYPAIQVDTHIGGQSHYLFVIAIE